MFILYTLYFAKDTATVHTSRMSTKSDIKREGFKCLNVHHNEFSSYQKIYSHTRTYAMEREKNIPIQFLCPALNGTKTKGCHLAKASSVKRVSNMAYLFFVLKIRKVPNS